MHEMLFDSLASDRHNRDVQRAEANYQRQVASPLSTSSPRARLASVLVTLATKLQPEIAASTSQPLNPATA